MKRILCGVVSILIILGLCACGDDTETAKVQTTESFSIEQYRNDILVSCSSIYNESTPLVNAGKFMYNYCNNLENLGGSGSPDQKAVEKSFTWLAENSEWTRDAVDLAYVDIKNQYKNIILIEPIGREAEMLSEYYSDMFDAYDDLYNLVTDPSGSLDSYVNEYNECITVIKDCYDDITLLAE